MTRITTARVAGFTFLLYIVAALSVMILSGKAAEGEGIAAKLAYVAEHSSETRLVFLLDLLCCFCAVVLAVTLYAMTREEDPDLALMVLTCRTAEGVIGAVSVPATLGKLWLATASGPDAPSPAAAAALGASLFELPSWSALLAATFFAVGSTFFSYLLLRGRMVPVVLAWVGLLASILVVVAVPLELVGLLRGLFTRLMWIPMLVFEVSLGIWLLVKGVAAPGRKAEIRAVAGGTARR
jgi:hypothetical protein